MHSNKPVRSDKYQQIFHETYAGDEFLATFNNTQSLSGLLNPFEYNEEVLDLEDELKRKFWAIAELVLTENQKKIIKLKCDGYTQVEIAKILDLNQSSICKCIQGNVDYSVKGKPKIYGGAVKKLRKLVLKNTEIKELLDRINELKEERF